jgi:hypothetical protein
VTVAVADRFHEVGHVLAVVDERRESR